LFSFFQRCRDLFQRWMLRRNSASDSISAFALDPV
jgi:hypothetical protein